MPKTPLHSMQACCASMLATMKKSSIIRDVAKARCTHEEKKTKREKQQQHEKEEQEQREETPRAKSSKQLSSTRRRCSIGEIETAGAARAAGNRAEQKGATTAGEGSEGEGTAEEE